MKTWDFEDEYGSRWWCSADNKAEAMKEARKVLQRNKKFNSGKRVIGLHRNSMDEFEDMSLFAEQKEGKE